MSWLVEWPAFLVAVATLLIPGLVAALLLRLRGFSVLAVAAPLSLGVIAGASLINVLVPFRWGPLAWIISVVAVLTVAWAVGLLSARRQRPDRDRQAGDARAWSTWLPFISVAIAVCVITPRLIDAFGQPENISQTFDNVYHLNAVRHMVDTGFIAPTRQIVPGFYPSLWHALTATVVTLSGTDIPTAVNMVSLVLGALVWPVSCVWLVRQITGNSTATLVAGPLAAAFAAFPLLMLDFGVLYPNVLSISLLPAALAALISVCGFGTGDRPPAITRWAILLGTVAVLALAHPSTLMAFFAIGIWPAVWAGVRWFAGARARGQRRWVIISVSLAWIAGLAVATLLLRFARPTRDQAFWPPSTSVGEAATQFLLNGPVFRPWEMTVSAFVLLGVIVVIVWQRHRLWLVPGWLTIGSLYVVCASFPTGRFRYGLTGTWFSDLYRIAALVPAAALPLAAIGFASLVGWISHLLLRRHSDGAARRVEFVTVAVGVTAVVALTQLGPALQVASASARGVYAITDSSALLTLDERALLDRVAEQVPRGDVVVGNPWTGTSLVYALADRMPMILHIYAQLDEDMETVVLGLDSADDDPAVCRALERTGVRWVLEFGTQEVHGAEHSYPGLEGLADAASVELVDSQGPNARLYRVIACD